MARLMSVSMTEQAVLERRKTVTRRKGWLWAKTGDRVVLCRKVMGRKPGEPLVRLAEVVLVDVRREPLAAITDADVAREGFPAMSRVDFINRFFVEAQGIYPHEEVTRIEWQYVDYVTVQMSAQAPGGPHLIHLAPPAASRIGGVANNACGLDRHARDDDGVHLYGFSVGGGWSDPAAEPCTDCSVILAGTPGARVSGMFAGLFAEHAPGGVLR